MNSTAIVLGVLLLGQVGNGSQLGKGAPKSSGLGSRYGAPATSGGEAKSWQAPATEPKKKSAPGQFFPSVPTESSSGPSFSPKTLFPQEKSPAKEDDSSLVAVPQNTESVPALLIRRALSPPAEGALPGKNVTLTQLLGGKDALQPRHMEIIRSYYKLCGAVADYHYSLDEYKRLGISASRVDVEFPVLTTAIASALTRVHQSKLEAVQAQLDLARQLRAPIDAPLPLPGDTPLVGPYRTYFQELYARRGSAWTEARRAHEISDTLPLWLDTIRESANRASAAKELLIDINSHFKKGDASPLDLLACHLQMREQRKAFVRSVRDYNLAIAEYAILVAPSGSQAASLLPMLVRRPAPQRLSNVYPPPGTIPVQTAVTEGTAAAPPTFAAEPDEPAAKTAVAAGFEQALDTMASELKVSDTTATVVPVDPVESSGGAAASTSPPAEPGKFTIPAEEPVKQLRSVVVPSRKKRP